MRRLVIFLFLITVTVVFFKKRSINRKAFESRLQASLNIVAQNSQVDSIKYLIDYAGCNCMRLEFYGLLKNKIDSFNKRTMSRADDIASSVVELVCHFGQEVRYANILLFYRDDSSLVVLSETSTPLCEYEYFRDMGDNPSLGERLIRLKNLVKYHQKNEDEGNYY